MDYYVDVHCHTISSGHAYSTLKEYVEEAPHKGLSLIAITDHAPKMTGAPSILHFLNLRAIPKEINGVEVLTGAELNILNPEGEIDLPPGILKDLDVVIASFHLPCFKPKNKDAHTRAVINTMKNPYIKIIGHLGDPRYPVDMEAVVLEANRYGVALEINNASFDPRSTRSGGEENVLLMAELCKINHVPVILGSDAHIYSDLGNFEQARRIIEAVDMPAELVLNTSVSLFKKHIGKEAVI